MKAIDLLFVIQKHTAKLADYFKKKGIWRTILRSLVWVCYQKDEFLFFELNLLRYSPPRDLIEAGDFIVATSADIKQIPNYFDGWFSKGHALRRLERGCKLFIVRKQQEVVSYRWVEFGRVIIPALGLSFTVPETTAYIAFSYTLPDHRNAGVASWSHHCTLEFLRSIGYRQVFVIISPGNVPPMRMMKTSGFRLFQVVTYQRFFLSMKHYYVRDPDTHGQQVFWGLWKSNSKVWNAFSQSVHD